MNSRLRVLPLVLLVILALGVPVFAQDTPEAMTTSADGWITYAAPNCDYGGELQSITAVDATTVTLQLCYPDPALPSKVAFSAFGIHSSDQLQSTGGGGDILTNPIGTGPYKIDHWDLGNEVVFTRNDEYWGDLAKEATLIFRWNAESAARLTELQAGSVDGIDNPGPLDFPVIESDPNLQLLPREGLNVLHLGINNTYPPFDNVKVRQALAYALDKQRIVDNFFPPGSSVADQFMPTSIFGYTPEVTPFPYDPTMSAQLLDEAAAEDGLTLPIVANLSYREISRSYWAQPNVIVADIQSQLNSVGCPADQPNCKAYLDITLDKQEPTTFLDNASAGAFPLFMLGWGADYPDATNFLDYHFGSGSNAQFGNKFPEITEPLQQGARLAKPEDRYPFYVAANTAIRDLVPMVPISHSGSAAVYRAAIQNAHVSPLGNEQFALMEDPDDDNFIWYQSGEPGSLYCADETDGESLRACEQVNEALLGYEVGGTAVVLGLADSYEASEDLMTWTFHLREGVKFHDGSDFDANDVVMTYAVQWDAANPLHIGRQGNFDYWSALFGGFLNPPAA